MGDPFDDAVDAEIEAEQMAWRAQQAPANPGIGYHAPDVMVKDEAWVIPDGLDAAGVRDYGVILVQSLVPGEAAKAIAAIIGDVDTFRTRSSLLYPAVKSQLVLGALTGAFHPALGGSPEVGRALALLIGQALTDATWAALDRGAIEAIRDLVGAADEASRAVRDRAQQELDDRGPAWTDFSLSKEEGSPRIHLFAEGVKDVSIANAKDEITRVLSANDWLASSFDGIRLVIAPEGETLQEQEPVFARVDGEEWGDLLLDPEPVKPKNRVPDNWWNELNSWLAEGELERPKRKVVGLTLTDDAREPNLFAVHEENLLHYHWWSGISPTERRDLSKGDPSATYWTLHHEIGMATLLGHLANIPPETIDATRKLDAPEPGTDPAIWALAQLIPGDGQLISQDATAVELGGAMGIIEAVWKHRTTSDEHRGSGFLLTPNSKDDQVWTPAVWFADAVAIHLAAKGTIPVTATQLAKREPELCALLEALFGPSTNV
jgi:hypothetical protein